MINLFIPLVLLHLNITPVHDGKHDAWFQSLHTPGGFPCCDHDDCRNVPARLNAEGHWEAWVDSVTFPDEPETMITSKVHGHAPDDWVEVPDKAVLVDRDNPTPGPVLCWYNHKPLCLIPGEGN